MARRHPTAALALALGLATALSGCGARPGPELRIGLILPMSGSLQSLAGFAMEGARLAVAELESAGGLVIGGRACPVVLITRDAQSSPELAVAAAQELINTADVSAIVGPPLSAQAIPVAQLASRAGVPMVVQLATHPEVTRGTTGVLRICFVDTFQGTALARYARESLGATRAAVLYDATSPLPRDITGVFVRQFEGSGGKPVAIESFTTGQEDLRAALGRIAASAPEVLFLPNYRADLLQIAPQIRELGLSAQILGCDTMRFATPEDARSFEGAYVTAHFVSDSPEPAAQAFFEAYKREYRRTPEDSAALTYDAINLLVQVARSQRSVDPKAIATGLAAIREFRGVTGTMRFDGSPDPTKSVVIAVFRNGVPTFRAQVNP